MIPGDADFQNLARAEARTRRERPPTRTPGQAFRVFWRYPTPPLISLLVVACVVVRATALGHAGLAWTEVALVAGWWIWWPFQEWVGHRFVLHIKPRRVFGRTFDPMFARRHRAHHHNPSDFPLVFLPIGVVLGAFVVIGGAQLWLVGPVHTATAMAGVSLAALFYEWTHYIAHCDYTPTGGWWHRVVKSHRMHHYRSEQHWYAFIVPHIDDWLGTGGGSEVPRTETTRSLGVPIEGVE